MNPLARVSLGRERSARRGSPAVHQQPVERLRHTLFVAIDATLSSR